MREETRVVFAERKICGEECGARKRLVNLAFRWGLRGGRAGFIERGVFHSKGKVTGFQPDI